MHPNNIFLFFLLKNLIISRLLLKPPNSSNLVESKVNVTDQLVEKIVKNAARLGCHSDNRMRRKPNPVVDGFE